MSTFSPTGAAQLLLITRFEWRHVGAGVKAREQFAWAVARGPDRGGSRHNRGWPEERDTEDHRARASELRAYVSPRNLRSHYGLNNPVNVSAPEEGKLVPNGLVLKSVPGSARARMRATYEPPTRKRPPGSVKLVKPASPNTE